GLRAMLVSVPVIMTAGYALVALAPGFMVLVVVYAVRRVGDYALTRPCRDALFTVVSREEKYKAKSLIDTFVYRGGDALSGSLYDRAFAQRGGRGDDLRGSSDAVITRLRQQPRDQRLIARELGRQHGERSAHVLLQHFHGAVARVGFLAGQHLVAHDPEAVEI